MGIVVDVISEAKVKGKIKTLNNCKKDLQDDSGKVSAINKNVNSLISDVQSFLGVRGAAKIVDRLEELAEPYQGSDACLSSAISYIDNEIYYLNKGLKEYAESNSSDGGGFR